MKKEVDDGLNALADNPEAQRLLRRLWNHTQTQVIVKERVRWARRVRRGGLFSAYHRKFEACSPRTRFGTIGFFTNGTLQRKAPLRDTGHRATLLNLVHCARHNWDVFSDEERQRTTEVLTGAIMTQAKSRSYRRWEDLPLYVLASLFEYPVPEFMSLNIACRTSEDEELIRVDITAQLIVRGMLWWDGFKKHCLSMLDADTRPKKGDVAVAFYNKPSSEDFGDTTFDQADLSHEANPLEHFIACETALEVLGHFGEQTKKILHLISEGYTIAETSERLGVGLETTKTLLKRSRKKAKESPELAAIRQFIERSRAA